MRKILLVLDINGESRLIKKIAETALFAGIEND